jgi:hypothetical protein
LHNTLCFIWTWRTHTDQLIVRTLRVPTVPRRSPLADRANMVNVRDPPDHNQPTRRGPTETLKNPLLAVAVARSYDRHRRPPPPPPLALIVVPHRLPSIVSPPWFVYPSPPSFHFPTFFCIVPSPSGSPCSIPIPPIYALILHNPLIVSQYLSLSIVSPHWQVKAHRSLKFIESHSETQVIFL